MSQSHLRKSLKFTKSYPFLIFAFYPQTLPNHQKASLFEKKDLRFGLNSIRGVSEKTLQSLLSFRDKTFVNKYEIFLAAKDTGLSIGVLQTLIQAGCMDSFGTERCLLVLEAQVFHQLTEKEKIRITELGQRHNYDILAALKEIADKKLFDEKGKPLISDKRMETLRSKYLDFRKIYNQNHQHKEFANWYFEKKLLGYSYSYNLRQVFKEPENTFTPVLRAKIC
jgi:DNA polymerase III alpha subunit